MNFIVNQRIGGRKGMVVNDVNTMHIYIYIRFLKLKLNFGVWKNDNWWRFTAIYTSYILLI